jgi:sec-independent protein translocase protein TatA
MGLDNPLHIVFLVVILLLVFGAKRLPEIGRSLGSGMREFKQSVTGEEPPKQQPALTAAQAPPPAAQAPVAQAPVAQAPPAPVPVAPSVPVPVAQPAPVPVAQPAPAEAAPAEPPQHS